MTRSFLITGAALLLVGTAPGELRAQPPVPGGGGPAQPAYSPYLNLLRPGGSVTQNYFGLVRPEIQARQGLYDLQSQITANQTALGNLQNSIAELGGTGHPTQFLNHRGYFMTNRSGGGGGGARR